MKVKFENKNVGSIKDIGKLLIIIEFGQKITKRILTTQPFNEKLEYEHQSFSENIKVILLQSSYYQEIKNGILVIKDALQVNHFTGISHTPTKNLIEHICQANGDIADYCKQYSNQLYNLHLMYAELVKSRYNEYREQQHNYHHYLSKVKSLSKSPEIDRFQRNKEKLKNACISYETKSQQFMQLLKATNEQAQKIWQKKVINFATAFVRSYSQVLKNTEELLNNNEDDTIIIDEEDIDLGPQLNAKKSQQMKDQTDEICLRIEKLLSEKEPVIPQILLPNFFKQNIQMNSLNLNNQSKQIQMNHKVYEDVSGLGSCQLGKNKKGENNEFGGKVDQFKQKNDFSIFENILSDKKQKKEVERIGQNTNIMLIQIPSKRPGSIQKVKKKDEVNLLDL